MSKEVNKEQAKAATQEEITELTDDQLDEAVGGYKQPRPPIPAASGDSGDEKAFEDITRSLGLG